MQCSGIDKEKGRCPIVFGEEYHAQDGRVYASNKSDYFCRSCYLSLNPQQKMQCKEVEGATRDTSEIDDGGEGDEKGFLVNIDSSWG